MELGVIVTPTAGGSSIIREGVNVANQSQTRSTSAIQADMGATRDRLVASVEALIDQVHPNRIKQRTVGEVKRRAHLELENVKSLVFNARGELRTDRVGVAAVASAGLVALIVVVKVLRRRRG